VYQVDQKTFKHKFLNIRSNGQNVFDQIISDQKTLDPVIFAHYLIVTKIRKRPAFLDQAKNFFKLKNLVERSYILDQSILYQKNLYPETCTQSKLIQNNKMLQLI
jgi:hypothetical protein